MNAEIQTLASLAIVALAATGLVLRGLVKKKSPGCGGDCGCTSQKISSTPRRS